MQTFSENTSVYNMNIFSQDKNLQLRQAVAFGDRKLVQKLLTVDKLDVNFTPDGQETYLHMAIARNDLSMVRLLLRLNANPNPILTASNAFPPLWLAILSYFDDVAELLIQFGANIHERLNLELKPLICSDYFIGRGKTSLLHFAIVRNCAAHVRLLLDYGADVNCWDSLGDESALQCAVFRGYIAMASFLIDRGAYLESANIDGMTSLHTALLIGNVDLIRMLLQRGANVMAVDSSGKTALHFVAECTEENIDIAVQILQMGVPVNQPELKCNMTPLHIALFTEKEKLAKLFVHFGADVRTRISNGASPVYIANSCCSPVTMSFLLTMGADPNEKTDDGETALHMAALADPADKIKVLLDYGADINIKDATGRTVFAWIANVDSDAAKVLVAHAAKLMVAGAFVEPDSLQVIEQHYSLRMQLKQCFGELEFIRRTAFYNKYTLRNLLDEPDKKLEILTKNVHFVQSFRSIHIATLVPNYARDLANKYVKAVTMRDMTAAMENHVAESFDDSLPGPVVENIVKHMNPQEVPNLVESVLAAMAKAREEEMEAHRLRFEEAEKAVAAAGLAPQQAQQQ